MSVSNGVVSTPITMSEVNNLVGASTFTNSAVCTASGVNMWAKYKPLDANLNVITEAVRKSKMYGLSIVSSNGLDKYAWDKPKGGSTSPYRMGDFNGYYHNAVAPYYATITTDQMAPNSVDFRDGMAIDAVSGSTCKITLTIVKRSENEGGYKSDYCYSLVDVMGGYTNYTHIILVVKNGSNVNYYEVPSISTEGHAEVYGLTISIGTITSPTLNLWQGTAQANGGTSYSGQHVPLCCDCQLATASVKFWESLHNATTTKNSKPTMYKYTTRTEVVSGASESYRNGTWYCVDINDYRYNYSVSSIDTRFTSSGYLQTMMKFVGSSTALIIPKSSLSSSMTLNTFIKQGNPIISANIPSPSTTNRSAVPTSMNPSSVSGYYLCYKSGTTPSISCSIFLQNVNASGGVISELEVGKISIAVASLVSGTNTFNWI